MQRKGILSASEFPDLKALKRALQALFMSGEADNFPPQAIVAKFHHVRLAVCIQLLETAQRENDELLFAKIATIIVELMGEETRTFIGAANDWSDRTTDSFKESAEAVRAEMLALITALRGYLATFNKG
jgi:hypothetical protein